MKYPIYKPKIFPNTKKYVEDCLDTNWISSRGNYIKNFEDSLADYLNVSHATTASNGTTALHLALCALDIGVGDEVIVPTFTYIASVNAIKYVGATPVFIDSERDTWNLDTSKIQAIITKKTKAIMAVHIYGNPCEMDNLTSICKSNDLFLIEDCAESLGSNYDKKATGSFGDVSTFSFFGNKTITTGEGGMVSSNDKNIIDRVASLKNHAQSDKKYWHEEVGFNYRMTNICAAIGLSQMENIGSISARKIEIAKIYKNLLEDQNIEFQIEEKNSESSNWLVSILLKNKNTRDELAKFLEIEGIETRPLFYPASRMPMYSSDQSFPVAEALSDRGMNLPSYPDLSNSDINYISGKIKTFLG
jgi:perosamine synthetase